MEKQKILTDEEQDNQINLIKSHLFKSLDILKSIEVRKDKTFCDECGKFINLKEVRKLNGKSLCWICWRSRAIIINTPTTKSAIALSDIANLPKILKDKPKYEQPDMKFEDLDLSNLTEENLQHLIQNKRLSEIALNKNQPIIEDVKTQEQPIIAPVVKIHHFNLLEGLSEFQKEFIKEKVKQGYHPLGFTVYTDTNEIYYFKERVF